MVMEAIQTKVCCILILYILHNWKKIEKCLLQILFFFICFEKYIYICCPLIIFNTFPHIIYDIYRQLLQLFSRKTADLRKLFSGDQSLNYLKYVLLIPMLMYFSEPSSGITVRLLELSFHARAYLIFISYDNFGNFSWHFSSL